MFNPLTPETLITAIGNAAADAARADGPASDFTRGQLLSAYSISRHLAAETAALPRLVEIAKETLAPVFEATPRELDCHQALAEHSRRILQSTDPREIGTLASAAIAALREERDPTAERLLARARTALRELSLTEVELLAERIEGPAEGPRR